jgi:hypothetical protein
MPIETSVGEDTDSDGLSIALEQLAEVDGDFNFASMQEHWSRRGALSPKQACLVIWRLQVCGIDHDPATLGLWVSTRAGDHEQIVAMEPWQRDRLLPYLNTEQREKFGL